MPIYEYECSACGQRSEFIQKFSDAAKTDCEKCGEKNSLSKLISSPAIQFKGDGWYLTDYSDKGKRQKSAEEKEKNVAPATTTDSGEKKAEKKKEIAKPATAS